MDKQNLNVLPEKRVKALAEKIGYGLKYLHDRRIVHRDIKSENILLSDASSTCKVPVITDFGYSMQLKEDEKCSKLCGSRKYIAPEILEQQGYSFPVDIWGFGVLLYSLVSTT